VDAQVPDAVVPHPVDLHGALRGGWVGGEEDPRIAVLGACEVAHPHHVGLAGQDVDLHRLGGVAWLTVGIEELGGDLRGSGPYVRGQKKA